MAGRRRPYRWTCAGLAFGLILALAAPAAAKVSWIWEIDGASKRLKSFQEAGKTLAANNKDKDAKKIVSLQAGLSLAMAIDFLDRQKNGESIAEVGDTYAKTAGFEKAAKAAEKMIGDVPFDGFSAADFTTLVEKLTNKRFDARWKKEGGTYGNGKASKELLCDCLKRFEKQGKSHLVVLHHRSGGPYHVVVVHRGAKKTLVFDPYQGYFASNKAANLVSELRTTYESVGFTGVMLLETNVSNTGAVDESKSVKKSTGVKSSGGVSLKDALKMIPGALKKGDMEKLAGNLTLTEAQWTEYMRQRAENGLKTKGSYESYIDGVTKELKAVAKRHGGDLRMIGSSTDDSKVRTVVFLSDPDEEAKPNRMTMDRGGTTSPYVALRLSVNVVALQKKKKELWVLDPLVRSVTYMDFWK
ncbi:hypothetical protein ACFL59_12110 [Planctomycetota bacterium]